MRNILKNLPKVAGVYLFKDKDQKVIYVGKAINLKSRISSYFQGGVSGKLNLLVSRISSVETIKVSSEIEALLLEAFLIKKYQPYFNSKLKDDKDYLYIIFTKENFPKVITGRKKDTVKAKSFFGPFTSSNAARQTLKIARKIFPFRTACRPNTGRACLSYHLGLCPGVCAGVISKEKYSKILSRLKRFLNGETGWVIANLEKEMRSAAKRLDFEEAEKIKLKINSIKTTTRKIEDVQRYLSGPEVLNNRYEQELASLKDFLKLTKIPERIECYDISNLGKDFAVGSMVVMKRGQISKEDYRRFRIKSVEKVNDPAMIAEVLSRRFENNWPRPDLILVDGGRTQLNAASKVLKSFGISTPIFGLAKKQEQLYSLYQVKPFSLPKNSLALYLLQRIRDEAHRFAISYHRKLRNKGFFGN